MLEECTGVLQNFVDLNDLRVNLCHLHGFTNERVETLAFFVNE